jgi:hypothetical protein
MEINELVAKLESFGKETLPILKEYIDMETIVEDTLDELDNDFTKEEFLNKLKEKIEEEIEDIKIAYPIEAIDFLKEMNKILQKRKIDKDSIVFSIKLIQEKAKNEGKEPPPLSSLNSIILANELFKYEIEQEIKEIVNFLEKIIK